MTLKKWVHAPFILGNDPIFKGSWRLQVHEYMVGLLQFSCAKDLAGFKGLGLTNPTAKQGFATSPPLWLGVREPCVSLEGPVLVGGLNKARKPHFQGSIFVLHPLHKLRSAPVLQEMNHPPPPHGPPPEKS